MTTSVVPFKSASNRISNPPRILNKMDEDDVKVRKELYRYLNQLVRDIENMDSNKRFADNELSDRITSVNNRASLIDERVTSNHP
jgi:hypothetical protein